MLFINSSSPCISCMGEMAIYVKHFWDIFLSLSLSLHFVQSMFTSHVYIVYLGLNQLSDPIITSQSHISLLSNVFAGEKEAKQSMLYSYRHSFSGFAAKLNSTQAATLANLKEVISVFQSRALKLHTTRSWDFLGLTLDHSVVAPMQLKYGDDIVVGVFDTGIWPESESFKEPPDLGPIPISWKGKCVRGEKFDPETACNRKLIGARYYLEGFEQQFGSLHSEYRSARDILGHGTHTASTAAGSIVKNASFFGFGKGTARGGAPRARLAVYKTCWGKNFDGKCVEADILAAFDDALHDGVDVISASIGATPPLRPFFASSADIGSFHAMQLGVTVVFSAGNDGPHPSLVQNVAPWSISVAASSIDRTFPAQLVLNSNFSIMGEGLITKEIRGRLVNAISYFDDGVCTRENWNQKAATGRIVLCFSTIGPVQSAEIAQVAVKRANGSALIFVEPPTRQIANVDIIPTIRFDISQGTRIQHYLAQSPRLPVAQILPSRTIIGKSASPVIAPFSSRGPSSISPDILKPDVSAPGINILAAWPPKTPPALFPGDDRSVNWNFQTGTSMSCPHVAGIVALLKSAHPEWSAEAIRSALITTAYTRDTTGDTILAGGSMKASDPFDIGAGHVNPLKAMDPGLVYELRTRDYIIFLCNLGYTQEQIRSLILIPKSAGTDTRCPSSSITSSTSSIIMNYYYINNNVINYPSITISNLKSCMTIKRTARNVDTKKRSAVYFASLVEPEGVEVVIWPRILIFTCWNKEMSYYVTLRVRATRRRKKKSHYGRYDFGEIVWSDGSHNVRSPLVVLVNY